MNKDILITISKEYYDNLIRINKAYEELQVCEYLFMPKYEDSDISIMLTKDGAIKKLMEDIDKKDKTIKDLERKLLNTTERLMRIELNPKKRWSK